MVFVVYVESAISENFFLLVDFLSYLRISSNCCSYSLARLVMLPLDYGFDDFFSNGSATMGGAMLIGN